MKVLKIKFMILIAKYLMERNANSEILNKDCLEFIGEANEVAEELDSE